MTHYLSSYVNFKTKEEMDAAARIHTDIHWNAMNKTDRAVLEMIRCYSVKYLAAHLKHETLEQKLGLSNSTVRRTLRKLENLQIIERIHYVRLVMSGLGANIYAILPVIDQGKMATGPAPVKADLAKVSKSFSGKEPSFSKSKILLDLIKRSPPAAEKLSTTLFGKMKSLLAFIGDSTNARKFFGIHKALSGMMLKFDIYKGKEELFEDLAYQAMHIAVMATKKKEIRNLPGYFNGVLREVICEALFKDIYQEYSVSVDDIIYPARKPSYAETTGLFRMDSHSVVNCRAQRFIKNSAIRRFIEMRLASFSVW
ncbi:DeoR family transcriptional regulator [Sporosarcina aquimarina]|uniref:DeoR family transcriptional regulator n=1 Tax=Sporosarcina aquimarina TaxID=114975 RepID=A0ABU4G2Y0_9BACL|nr:DeoR family transcriptional regulator [Sporosarcina aquimarina]MDW0110717.1 DeoR family transcriptional regulator [Sporosarcina aquimarina]